MLAINVFRRCSTPGTPVKFEHTYFVLKKILYVYKKTACRKQAVYTCGT